MTTAVTLVSQTSSRFAMDKCPADFAQGAGVWCDETFREALSRAVRRSRKPRSQIVKELSAATGCDISEASLNNFTAVKRKAYRFPAVWVKFASEILEDESLQRFLLTDRLNALVSLGEVEVEAECSRRKLLRVVLGAEKKKGR